MPILATNPATAQTRRIVVDKAPAWLYFDSLTGNVHVLTAGVDSDFNGELETDSGEVAPRWFVIDPVTETVIDSVTFNGLFNSFPIRPAVDAVRGRLYLPQMGRVREWDIRQRALLRDTVIDGNFAAVAYDSVNARLVLSIRKGFTNPGSILVIDAATADTVALVPGSVNPAMTGVDPETPGGGHYFTISEGAGTAIPSNLSRTIHVPDIYSAVMGSDMGGSAAYAAYSKQSNLVAIVLNGLRRVHVINSRRHQDLDWSPISIGSDEGPVGPRVAAFQGDSVLIVGTLSGEIHFIDITDGTRIDTITGLGHIGSIAVADTIAWVSMRATASGGMDSTILAVDIRTHQVIDTIYGGIDPATLFIDAAGDLHAIGKGGPGALAWWERFNGSTGESMWRRDLDGTIYVPETDPYQLVYDSDEDSLYLVVSDTLRAYAASNPGGAYRVVFSSTDAPVGIRGVGEVTDVDRSSRYLVVIIPPVNDSLGHADLRVLTHQGEEVARFAGGPRPLMVVPAYGNTDNGISFYQLDRGPRAAKRSQLVLAGFLPEIFTDTTLGIGANHIAIGEEDAAITLNGSHSIAVVDLDELEIEGRYDVGTTGFDGPRVTYLYDEEIIMVPTYAGDIRVIRADRSIRSFPVGGKAEDLVVASDKAFVAVAFAPDYTADSVVVVLDIAPLIASIRQTSHIASGLSLEQNHPNPASALTTIPFTLKNAGHVALDLYSLDGRHVATLLDRSMESGSWSVDLRADLLNNGTYIYTLRSETGVLSHTLQVVR